MARIPDRPEFQRRWGAMTAADRRRILRAVNRGQVLQDRRDAALAVVLARRQQRFWRSAGFLAPVIGLVVAWLTGRGADTAVLLGNAAVGSLVLGAMALWSLRRARRAEEGNTAHALRRRQT